MQPQGQWQALTVFMPDRRVAYGQALLLPSHHCKQRPALPVPHGMQLTLCLLWPLVQPVQRASRPAGSATKPALAASPLSKRKRAGDSPTPEDASPSKTRLRGLCRTPCLQAGPREQAESADAAAMQQVRHMQAHWSCLCCKPHRPACLIYRP